MGVGGMGRHKHGRHLRADNPRARKRLERADSELRSSFREKILNIYGDRIWSRLFFCSIQGNFLRIF